MMQCTTTYSEECEDLHMCHTLRATDPGGPGSPKRAAGPEPRYEARATLCRRDGIYARAGKELR